MENYFNYFTEIEERYQHCRGTKTLLSPLDWALIESWKDSGIPLEAVLAGIERAFEKYKARQRKYRMVNALAYCTQEVLRAAEEARGGRSLRWHAKDSPPPFASEDILRFLSHNAESRGDRPRKARGTRPAGSGGRLGRRAGITRETASQEPAKLLADLEDLEIRLTALEEKLTASLLAPLPSNSWPRSRHKLNAGWGLTGGKCPDRRSSRCSGSSEEALAGALPGSALEFVLYVSGKLRAGNSKLGVEMDRAQR